MDEFSRKVRDLAGSMSPLALRVASYLDRNRASALTSSATQLAAQLNTSDATVIRTVQALGYDGLAEMKQALAASLDTPATPAANMRRTLASIGKGAEDAVDSVLDAHRTGMQALQTVEGKAAIAAAIKVLHPARRIAIFGIGPSAHLAGYVALQLNRIGRESLVLDATGWGLADRLLQLRSGDAVLVLAYGKPYREAVAVMGEVERLDLTSVLVTDTEVSAMALKATVVLTARRGRANQFALHGTTFVALESIVLGLAAVDDEQTLGRLANLDRLRKQLGRR